MSCDLKRLDLALETDTRIAHCEKHGEFSSRGIRLSPSFEWIWEQCPKCMAELAELERKQSVYERASNILHHQCRVLNRKDAIPVRYQRKSFADIRTANNQQEEVKKCCQFYVEKFGGNWRSHGTGLTFYGGHGLGKTLHGTVILQALFPHVVGCYATMPEFLFLMGGTHGGNQTDPQEVFRLLSTTPLLVLDEFGTANWPNEQKLVFSLFDTRYRNCLPTILITNLTPVELQRLDLALHSRLTESSIFVPFAGVDYRMSRQT
jgi:DNA replication protein DnaC